MKALICDIKRLAVHDGDGIRTTVFFKGCPLKCLWCHNPESISFRPQEAFYENKCIGCGQCKLQDFSHRDCLGDARRIYGQEYTPDELLPLLLEDRDFYETSGGGVTLSGGECLCQATFCQQLLEMLKQEQIATAVDTCGFVQRSAIDRVLPYTDIFLYDLKAMDEEVHIRCTGQSNRLILENLKYIDSQGKSIEIRVPFVPNFNHDQMEKIADFVATLQHVTAVKILPYHNYAGSKYRALGMENTLPDTLPTPEQLQAAEAILNR